MVDTSTPYEVTPRILPIPKEEWTDAHREVFAFWGEPNSWEEGSKTYIIMAMANHPELAAVYNSWGKHFLMANTIPVRPMEIVILRVAWKLKSEYEWHNHVGYGVNAGLSLDEIAAIREGPDAPNWNHEDRTILRAIDEQMDIGRITDDCWAELNTFLDKKQIMDLVFTIGHYVMTSWAIASLGVMVEAGADKIGFDMKSASGRMPGATYKPGETENWTSTRGY
jgi:4-carboxymuconolactone decarboxylase